MLPANRGDVGCPSTDSHALRKSGRRLGSAAIPALTRKRSLVRTQYRPPALALTGRHFTAVVLGHGPCSRSPACQFAYHQAAETVRPSRRPRGVRTGRSSLRYTLSVTRVLAWPTKCKMSSIASPVLDSSETKLCRSSRGVTPRHLAQPPRRPGGTIYTVRIVLGRRLGRSASSGGASWSHPARQRRRFQRSAPRNPSSTARSSATASPAPVDDQHT